MTSLRAQVYATAAADSTLLSLLGAGAASLLGADGAGIPERPPAPWAYLEFDLEVDSLAPNVVDGLFRWRAYDDPQGGSTRLASILGRFLRLYPADPDGVLQDTTTGEIIVWQGKGVKGPEYIDVPQGLNQQWVQFPYRKGHVGF
jgi:hypothetical protein